MRLFVKGHPALMPGREAQNEKPAAVAPVIPVRSVCASVVVWLVRNRQRHRMKAGVVKKDGDFHSSNQNGPASRGISVRLSVRRCVTEAKCGPLRPPEMICPGNASEFSAVFGEVSAGRLEIRNPKVEIRKKPEFRSPKLQGEIPRPAKSRESCP